MEQSLTHAPSAGRSPMSRGTRARLSPPDSSDVSAVAFVNLMVFGSRNYPPHNAVQSVMRSARVSTTAARTTAASTTASRKRKTKAKSPEQLFKNEQKRLYMRQVRARQKSKIAGLELDVNELREQIHRIQEHKTLMETKHQFARVCMLDTATAIVRSYFDVFSEGFHSSTHTPMQLTGSDQSQFLNNIMVDDVITCGELLGIDALVDQWQRYETYFNLSSYKCHRLQFLRVDETPLVELFCTYKVLITRRTLEEVFPHVLANEEMAHALQGKTLQCDSRVMFWFDNTCKIVRYDDHSDFCMALSKIVNDPAELAFVMGDAKIAEQALIGSLEPCTTGEAGSAGHVSSIVSRISALQLAKPLLE